MLCETHTTMQAHGELTVMIELQEVEQTQILNANE